jgi:predicted  nucleic acid-binding Zn-ribbon protein
MEQEQMVNEYINTLAKKYNDASLEVVTLQARNSLLSKEKEQLLNKIETITKDMHDLENELQEERNKPPVTQTEIKEVEVVKEIGDTKLVKENEILKKELHALEEKIKKLREEKSNGNNSQAQKVRDS